MRITPIFNYNFSQTKQNFKKQTNNFQSSDKTQKLPIIPFYTYNINFMGGYSMDLSETLRNFDEYEKRGVAIYPPDIRELIVDELAKGNPDSKTLIDIHKKKYAPIKDCYDLNEVKEKFPEFKNVLSDTQVDYSANSFIDDVKQGKSLYFNKDEDLAFQLLKLYWSEGLSINGLKNYTDGKEVKYHMSKFAIPLVQNEYGKILKLSDKEYNKRFSEYMSEKAMEARDRKSQAEDGEPIYIPRGPLGESHKRHISEGLIRYYAQHPEKSGQISERQKQYFEDNPEQRLRMQKALLFAWNKTQEGRSIKKHMSKFFKKAGIKFDFIQENEIKEQTPEQRKTFREFWKANAWAKKQMSIATIKGWEKVKQDELKAQEIAPVKEEKAVEEVKSTYKILPQGLIDKTVKMIEEKLGQVNVSDANLDLTKDIAEILQPNEELDIEDYCGLNFSGELQTIQWMSVLSMRDNFSRKKLPLRTLNDKKFYNEIYVDLLPIFERVASVNKGNLEFDSVGVSRSMRTIAKKSYDKNHPEMIEYLERKLERAYEIYNIADEKKRKEMTLKFIGS